ncbi:unknown [Bacteroides sp. CAG:633]|nr:unknown [Bacteroides sp. CAG:633]
MFLPRAPHVACNGYGATSATVVAHVQHQYAGLYLCNLCFGGVAACRLTDVPCLAVVLAVDDAGTGDAVGTDVLAGKDQRAVFHGYASSGSLEQEEPFGIFYLRSNVDGSRPCLPVIVAASQHKLGRFVQLVPLSRVEPGTEVAHAVCPGSHNPDGTRLTVYQDGRIAYAVLGFRQMAVFAEAHGDTHLFPCLSAVCATAEADVDMFLQIGAVVVAYVVHTEQGSLVAGDNARNAVGGCAVIACMAYTNARKVLLRRGQCVLQGSCTRISLDRTDSGGYA